MRYLLIFLVLPLAACGKSKAAEPPVEAASFVPKECAFVQNEAADSRFASGFVDKYSCAGELTNMSCFAYAQGEESLYLTCELISPSVPQGVPAGCTLHDADGAHAFLDDNIESALVYDCGTLNDNLRCFYFESKTTTKEEVRCNLM